jgi:phosphatidylethanolamine-binding protein (PEBP) family uncharacterized protein
MIAFTLAMTLLSGTFQPNATVPLTMVAKDCGGSNVSPELHWSGVPAGTKSLALIVHDPDAPVPGGFYHWALYDLTPGLTHFAAGIERGYYGPCPPAGKVHHYHFTLYALDVENVGAAGKLDAKQLLAKIQGHVIAQTTLTGLYQTH